MKNNKALNVLYFCSSGVYGGAENFVEYCLKSHQDDSHINAQAFLLNDGPFYDRLKRAQIKATLSPIKVRLKNVFSWIMFQIWFFKFLKKENIQIIHTTMPYSQFYASVAGKLVGCKIVWFQHGPVGGFIDKVSNFLPCDLLLFNSNFTMEEHKKTVGPVKPPFKIINPPVSIRINTEEVKVIKSNYSFRDKLFVCAGRICRWKGYETAISAISQLIKAHKKNCQLLIIGKASTEDDKKYCLELEELINKEGLGKHIELLGFRENVQDFISAADFLIHCSNIPEPFGLVIAEAIKIGTPVLAPAIGGALEQLQDSKNLGSLYEPNNSNLGLTKQILSLYELEMPKLPALKSSQDIEIAQILKKFYSELS